MSSSYQFTKSKSLQVSNLDDEMELMLQKELAIGIYLLYFRYHVHMEDFDIE